MKKRIFSLFMVLGLVASVAFAAGNKNDLAYKNIEELQVTSAVELTDGVIVVESGIPKQGGTVSDILALSSSSLLVDSYVAYSAGAGALPITANTIYLTTGGAEALTLADGVVGQRLTIVMVSDGGDGTLTPANYANGTTITFDNFDSVVLSFDGTNWHNVGTPTAAVA